MKTDPEFIDLTDNDNALFEEFLKEDNEEELEYDEEFLLFDIQEQRSNIFHAKSFIQADKTIQNEEIDECSSENDNEIDDENIDYEQEKQELENESEMHENEIHIIDETLSIPLLPCIIIDTMGKLI
ncbi:hypothetical protein C1645_835942 [Glomus cerebriforme]|uniref:Uncharacterized protein n=1 Tax=Glomus cerebriforme TaxID=658196 RepID=A0A397S6S0_9GLOM|nr:hypothetical protein C1645_835942 [Glomus cerebriforme]